MEKTQEKDSQEKVTVKLSKKAHFVAKIKALVKGMSLQDYLDSLVENDTKDIKSLNLDD